MISPFLRFVLANPQFPWNWGQFTHNPAVTLEDYLERPNLPWKQPPYNVGQLSFDALLERAVALGPAVAVTNLIQIVRARDYTFRKLMANIDTFNRLMVTTYLPPHNDSFDDENLYYHDEIMDHICTHASLDIKCLLEYRNFRGLNWGTISIHDQGVSFSDIIAHPELPWVWWRVLDDRAGRVVSIQDLLALVHSPVYRELNWNYVSSNRGITTQDVDAHPELSWDYYGLSRNPNVTLDYVLAHLDRNDSWFWDSLSANPHVVTSMRCVHDHPELPWCYNGLARNPKVSIDELLTKVADATTGEPIGLPSAAWSHLSTRRDLAPECLLKDIGTHKFEMYGVSSTQRWPLHVLVDTIKPIYVERYKQQLEGIFRDGEHYHLKNDMSDLIQGISINRNRTTCDLLENPKFPWDWRFISCNPLGLQVEVFEPTREHRNKFQRVLASIECMPVGYCAAMPDGGVEYQRQLTTLQAMYPAN